MTTSVQAAKSLGALSRTASGWSLAVLEAGGTFLVSAFPFSEHQEDCRSRPSFPPDRVRRFPRGSGDP